MPLPKLVRWLFWSVGGILLLGIAAVAFVAGANLWILRRAKPHIVTSLEKLPPQNLGIVLGTSPRGRVFPKNPFFEHRMDAAAKLYKAGKVKHLLLTGDNSTKDYDEVNAMRDALAARGVPKSATTLDYAGFRTLDSMARARKIFGVQKATLITDDFHMARTVFLARRYGMEVIGYPSEPVPQKWSRRVRTREIASRVVAVLDVYLLRTKAKFYGEPVQLPVATQ